MQAESWIVARSVGCPLRMALIALVVAGAPSAVAAPNPAPAYCAEMGYALDGGDCAFPDGSRCESWAFYRGECGARWGYCEQHGGRIETRVEERGSWTAKYAACLFDDGSECGEQAWIQGMCGPGECARWAGSECAEVIPPEEPVQAPADEPRESPKEHAERMRARMGLGPAPEARHTSYGCSYFKRGNPPLSRQVLRPGDLLTIDLCPAEKLGCEWDDQAEIGNLFVLHQEGHKDLERRKELLRFKSKERFQFQMDDPGNSLITFRCRADRGEVVRQFVTAVTVDPAATRVYFDKDGIQVMTAEGVKKFTPDMSYMGYMLKCKMVEKGKEPIDRISSGLFDQFGFIMCAADWMDCDWIDEPTISDTGIVVQYNHKHVENPAFRKFPEERFDFQTIGEGSSEITFSCVNDQGEEVRSHTVTLNVGRERWAEIIEYKKKEKKEESSRAVVQPPCKVYEGACPQACDDCCMHDRLDYVYLKDPDGGLRLTPIEAKVLRDWKYTDPACMGGIETDLSDHYPLLVKFSIDGPVGPRTKKELTVLNYNTHLFYGLKGNIAEQQTHKVMVYQDVIRSREIVARIKAIDADIVGLQEVWSPDRMEFFAAELGDVYPFQHFLTRNPGIRNTSGAMLFSKLPLKDTAWGGYAVHYPVNIAGLNLPDFLEISGGKMPQDAMATKGVLVADVELRQGGPTLRVAVTHALTDQHVGKGVWRSTYVPRAITSFRLDGATYLFALTTEIRKDREDPDVAEIYRIYDWSYGFDGEELPDAGWKRVYRGPWSSSDFAVVSFRLEDRPYLLGLDAQGVATVYSIEEGGLGWNPEKTTRLGSDYLHIKSFRLEDGPYLFGMKRSGEARIWKIGPNGLQPVYQRTLNPFSVFVDFFELNGHTYMFSVEDHARHKSGHRVVTTRDGYSHIRRINDDGSGWIDVHEEKIEMPYLAMAALQLNGHPYIFGFRGDWQIRSVSFAEALEMAGSPFNISKAYRTIKEDANVCREPIYDQLGVRTSYGSHLLRINDAADGREEVFVQQEGKDNDFLVFVPFELNGHPWLFGLKDMPGEKLGHLPGEGYLRRIDEDGRGWQDLFKLPHIQRLIDVTLRDERTTIVMGDLNVHWDHYANMNKMFNEFGFTDAYAAVHGVDMQDSWTADLCDNTLTQVFGQESRSPGMLDREGNEYFYNAAYGTLCLQRDCPVCEAPAGEDAPGPRQD